MKIVKDGGSYSWNNFNVYLPPSGRYEIVNISTRKVVVGDSDTASFNISAKVSSGTFSGGQLICSGSAYNKITEVYGFLDITYQKVL